MKKTVYAAIVTLTFLACSAAATNEQGQPVEKPVQPQTIFTQQDAEKIMGEPARLKDSSSKMQQDVQVYNCSYIASQQDGGKTGNIYFMYEQYTYDSSAHRVYTDIRISNEHSGIKLLQGMGDEAYFHTDRQNFYFILARKGNRMIRMKVNKITSHTSEQAFNEVAARIVAGF